MSLNIGMRLGPYEILHLVGTGGMGEVYRAKDVRLGRLVAIKVLAPHVSGRRELRERFDREARAISSLSHPNICALYDIGHQEGIDYLVMEYLEGESLASRLEKGPLPQDQLLRYAFQIADALDKAHRQGIIHRDLKPGNIMLTKSGAKLLDFGLAKLRDVEMQSPISLVHGLPTSAGANLTAEGTILGTIQYMSPEQLEGKETDHRTDIFAFGAVFYEMATAKKAFEGQSHASLIAAILKAQPAPISQTQKMWPASLERVVTKCLAKDPDERWQSAADLASELRWISEGGSQLNTSIGSAIPILSKKQRNLLARILLAAFFLTSIGLALHLYRLSSAPREIPLLKLSIVPQTQTRPAGPLALSPDGQKLIFVAANRQGVKMLWMREFDALEPKSLAGTEDGNHPFWSPDGRFVGFFTQAKLKKMEVGGGPPQSLADVSGPKGGTWNSNGTILFAPAFTGGIHRISVFGGEAEQFTQLDRSRQESSHRWPWFLPDGKHFLYVILAPSRNNCGIFVGSIDDPKLKKQLSRDFSRVEYAAPGYLIFVRGNTLMAQGFDDQKLELKGDALSLGEKAGYDGYSAYGAFSASGNRLLAFGTLEDVQSRLSWFDRNGKRLKIVGEPADYGEPSFSPDEQKVLVVRADQATGNNDLWVVELARDTFSRFTFDPSNEVSPLWSPDGSQIVYCSNPEGRINIFTKASSGTGPQELLVNTENPKYPDDWSRDGKFILYDEVAPKTKFDIWYLPLTGERKPVPFLQTQFNETHARFSPDGKWIAYSSDETGKSEIYVRRFPPAAEGKWQISANGGDQAQWSHDGKELFYLATDKNIMSVRIERGENLGAGVPIPLFEVETVPNGLIDDRNQYLVSADGKRFLFAERAGDAAGAPLHLVFQWPSLLNR